MFVGRGDGERNLGDQPQRRIHKGQGGGNVPESPADRPQTKAWDRPQTPTQNLGSETEGDRERNTEKYQNLRKQETEFTTQTMNKKGRV